MITPHMGPGYPLYCLFPMSIHFIFCSFYFFPFFLFLNALRFFVRPFPFYQNSHHSVSKLEIIGGDRTWV